MSDINEMKVLKEKVERIENHHKFMKDKVMDIDGKVTTIYSSIIGNELGSQGIVKQLSKIEETINGNIKDIDELKNLR